MNLIPGVALPVPVGVADCLDCDELREVDRHARCLVCGSASVLRRNAIRAMACRVVENRPKAEPLPVKADRYWKVA